MRVHFFDSATPVSDSRAVVTNFANGSFGETTSVGNPDAGITNYVFDVAGRLSTEADGNLSIAYGWDALGRAKEGLSLKRITGPKCAPGKILPMLEVCLRFVGASR